MTMSPFVFVQMAIYLFIGWVRECACTIVYEWKPEDGITFKSFFSASIIWIQRTELNSSGLEVRASSSWAFPPALVFPSIVKDVNLFFRASGHLILLKNVFYILRLFPPSNLYHCFLQSVSCFILWISNPVTKHIHHWLIRSPPVLQFLQFFILNSILWLYFFSLVCSMACLLACFLGTHSFNQYAFK